MKASTVVKQHTHKSWTKTLEFRLQFVPAVDTFSLDMVGSALHLISIRQIQNVTPQLSVSQTILSLPVERVKASVSHLVSQTE